jgi:hypothetical protein
MSIFMDLQQRFKEELFLTHFTKHIFHMQLSKQELNRQGQKMIAPDIILIYFGALPYA